MAAPNIVNITSVYGKTMGVGLNTTSNTTILTCGADKVLKINTVNVSNVDGINAVETYVYFYDASAVNRYSLGHELVVPASASLIVVGKDSPIYLEESDRIEAWASANNDAHIVISYEEIDDA
jgi:hypothetical protein